MEESPLLVQKPAKKIITLTLRKGVYLPYLVLEKLRDRYMSIIEFNKLCSTCATYRNFYATKMNSYWFERYMLYYMKDAKLAKHRKHCERVSYACAKDINLKHGFGGVNFAVINWIKEMKKQSKKPKRGVIKHYSKEDLIKASRVPAIGVALYRILTNCCMEDSHITYDFNHKKFNTKTNYFIKFMNGKHEKLNIESHKLQMSKKTNRIQDEKMHMKSIKAHIKTLEVQYLQISNSMVKYEKELQDTTDAYEKLLKIPWDQELFPTIVANNPEITFK